MKVKSRNQIVLLSCAVGVLSGCAQQQQRASHQPAAVTVAAPEVKAPLVPVAAYGPSHTTFEENGMKWIRGSMAFPTGVRETSGLLVEKTVPAEVLVGQKFDYAYKVSNLTDQTIQSVTLSDRVPPNFTASETDPKPTEIRDGVAVWQLGTLGPRESKTVHVKGSSPEEGAVNTCGWASYSPFLCEDIKVLKANLQLVRQAPPEALICDPIPMTLTVKNTGSSRLSAVKITDPLPDGLTSEGKNSLAFDVGDLAPGEAREFKFNAVAAKTGPFANKSQATAGQGLQADASTTTIVREPVLTLSCTAPEERYMGRPFDVGFTVVNKGDAVADGAALELPVPEGLTFKSASNNGQVSANKVTWNLGALTPNASQQVSATFVGPNGGSFQFAPAVKGTCAKQVTTACQTRVIGVPAILLEKADDPDPVGVDETTTYTVKITNQGSADDENVLMVVTIAPELVPVSATGEGSISGQTVTFPAVRTLKAKQAVSYQITAKGVKAGDGRTRFELKSGMLRSPVIAEESTHVY